MSTSIHRSYIDDCCASNVFSRLGSAHGHPRATNFEEFAKKIMSLGYNRINVAITNRNQAVEEEYLTKTGFKCVFETDPNGGAYNLKLWAASNKEIDASLVEIRLEMERKRKEELEKKRAEEAERRRLQQLEQERVRKENEEKLKKVAEQNKNIKKFPRPLVAGDIRAALIGMPRNTLTTGRPVTIGAYLQNFYNLKTPLRGVSAGTTSTAYFWGDEYRTLARSINKRLRDEGRLD